MKNYNCQSCGVEFQSKKGCSSRQPKYCSSKCFGKTMKIEVYCKSCGKLIENKHSVKISNRVYCSVDCQAEARRGVSLSPEWREALSEGRKNSEKCKGENLYNWKGGKETEAVRLKQSFYKRKMSLKEKMPIAYLGRVLAAQGNKCFFCESDLSEYKAIEHLTPVSKGGDNHPYNLVYSCKSCNSIKRQKTLEEFAITTKNIKLIDKFDLIYSTAL